MKPGWESTGTEFWGYSADFGGRHIRVKGSTKVMAHLMFGIIALCADQLLRLII